MRSCPCDVLDCWFAPGTMRSTRPTWWMATAAPTRTSVNYAEALGVAHHPHGGHADSRAVGEEVGGVMTASSLARCPSWRGTR